jgi:hypothetical protein
MNVRSVLGRFPASPLAMGLLVAVAAAPSHAQRVGTPIQPGLYELLVDTRSPVLTGPPGAGQPRMVTGLKVCFGDAQAADPVAFISDTILPPARGCTTTSLRQSGPRVTWSLSCTKDGLASAQATFEFSATRFSGTMRHEIAVDPAKPQPTTYSVQARRLGDC